jgi:undecaprenyl-diphosphatase
VVVYELYQTLKDPKTEVFSTPQTFVATVIAFTIGYIVIAWLMKYISSNSYKFFVIYRVILGFAVLIAITTNLIS